MRFPLHLVLGFTLIAAQPLVADPPPVMTLLGVDSNMQGQPLIAAAATPATTATTAAAGDPRGDCGSSLTLDQLKARLHAGGQKQALIVRGGRFGINPYILQIIQRAASAFSFDASVQRFLQDNLSHQYISDDQEVAAQLTQLGYTVKELTSAGYAANLSQFKTDVLAELKKPETTVMVFYGHGSTGGFWLLDDRENNMPGLDEIIRDHRMVQPDVSVSVDELHDAVKDRGGLDALIMQGCQNGTTSYQRDRGRAVDGLTFSDCVKAGSGFFAGWATFSVYLHMDSVPIFQQWLCHASQFDPAHPDATKDSAHYYSAAGGIGREMSMIAFEGDGSGFTQAELAADPKLHMHTMDYLTQCQPVYNFVHLGYRLKFDPAPLASLVRDFLIAHYRYCVANNVPMQQPGQGAPPHLSDAPTTAEINQLLAYHAHPIMNAALSIVAPGLVYLDSETIRFDDGDTSKLFADLSLHVNNSTEIQHVLDVVKNSQDYTIRENLNAGVGAHLGNQLADGIASTIQNARNALGDTVATANLQLALEKVEKQDGGHGTGIYAIKPWVGSYHLEVGNVPARLHASTSPYEIHIAMSALDTFVRQSLSNMFPGEVELRYDPGRLMPYLYAYLSLRNDMQGHVVADGSTGVSTTSTWQFRVNWFHLANGYAYADSNASVSVQPAGDLKVSVTPTLNLWLTTGWGLLDSWPAAKAALSVLASNLVTGRLRDRASAGIDFASYIPDNQKADVVGVVEIKRIVVSDDAVSVYIDRK